MRIGLLIVIPRAGETFEVIAGPEVPLPEQLAEFKKRAGVRENEELAEIQLWVSDAGVVKRHKFRPAGQAQLLASMEQANAEAERARAAQAAADKATQATAENSAEAKKVAKLSAETKALAAKRRAAKAKGQAANKKSTK